MKISASWHGQAGAIAVRVTVYPGDLREAITPAAVEAEVRRALEAMRPVTAVVAK